MLAKNSSTSRLNASRSVLSKSGNRFTTGSLAAMPRIFSHWPVKFRTSACERGSAIMRSTCCFSTFGIMQLVGGGELDQLQVGDAAPQEERQARRQFQIADPVGGARRRLGRLDLGAVDEIRIGQQALDHRFDAGVELAALLTSAAVEGGHRLDVGVAGRTAEGLRGQRGDDPAWRSRLPRRRSSGSTRRSCDGSAYRWPPCP